MGVNLQGTQSSKEQEQSQYSFPESHALVVHNAGASDNNEIPLHTFSNQDSPPPAPEAHRHEMFVSFRSYPL